MANLMPFIHLLVSHIRPLIMVGRNSLGLFDVTLNSIKKKVQVDQDFVIIAISDVSVTYPQITVRCSITYTIRLIHPEVDSIITNERRSPSLINHMRYMNPEFLKLSVSAAHRPT